MNNLSEWAEKNPKGYISIGDACGIQEMPAADKFVKVGQIKHGRIAQHALVTANLFHGSNLYAKADDIAPDFMRRR